MENKKKEEVNKVIDWSENHFPNSVLPLNSMKASIKYIILCIDIFDFLIRISDDDDFQKTLTEVRTVYMWLMYYLLNYSDVAYESSVRSAAEWTMRLCVKYADGQITFLELSNMNHSRMWQILKDAPDFKDKDPLNNINNLFAKSSSNIHRSQFSNTMGVNFLNDIIKEKDNKTILRINKDIKCFYNFMVSEVWRKKLSNVDQLTIAQKMEYKNINEYLS